MYILDTDICVFWLKGNRSIEMIIEKQRIPDLKLENWLS